MRALLFLIILVSVTAGCANRKHYRDIAATWKGSPVDRLITSWGAPDKSVKVHDNMYVITYIEGTGVSSTYIPIAQTGMGLMSTNSRYCEVTFVYDKNRVITHTNAEGNNCR